MMFPWIRTLDSICNLHSGIRFRLHQDTDSVSNFHLLIMIYDQPVTGVTVISEFYDLEVLPESIPVFQLDEHG